jgi:VanZ family protein
LPTPSGRPIDTLPVSDLHLSRKAISVLSLLTLCTTLLAGLWPFYSPTNEVTWTEHKNALQFGDHGTALSSGAFVFSGYGGPACSLELWLEPAVLWTHGSVLTFYRAANSQQFSMQQDMADLVLQRDVGNSEPANRSLQIRVDNVFRRRQVFIAITSDGQRASIYLDGHLATISPDFGLSSNDLSAQLILADSPLRSHSWHGRLRGLAIYGSDLSPEQVARHYEEWTDRQGPVLDKPERALAVYLFNEDGGRVIHDAAGSGTNLEIPSQYSVVDQLFFEPPWQEFHTQPSYLKNCAINLIGFVPLGFCYNLYFTAVCKIRRASLVTIALGLAVSLVIEFFQAYLPTRYSGMTDVITNTLGTCIGVVVYRAGILQRAWRPVFNRWTGHDGRAQQ